jgi:hypothetical protein
MRNSSSAARGQAPWRRARTVLAALAIAALTLTGVVGAVAHAAGASASRSHRQPAARSAVGARENSGPCVPAGPGPVPAGPPPGNPGATFCRDTGTFGWSSKGESGNDNCDGATLPFNNCFPGLHYFIWVGDYFLAWAARDYLASLVTLLVTTPDVSSIADAGGALGGVADQLYTLARALAGLFIVVTIFRYFLLSIGQSSLTAPFAGVYRSAIGFGILTMSKDLIGIWFSGLSAITAQVTPRGFLVFPISWLDENTATPPYYAASSDAYYNHTAPYIANQSSWWVGAFLVVLTLLFVVLLFSVFVRMSGLFALIALFVVAPLCIVTWITPEFSGIARWWWASFIAYSLWGLAYAVVLLTCGAVTADGSFAGIFVYPGLTLSGDQVDFFRMLVAIAGLLTLTRIPELMEGMMGGLTAVQSGVAGVRGSAFRAARVLTGGY